MGEEAQEQALRLGHEYQKAAEGSLEAASRSFGEVNRGWQAIAAEVTDFSKRRFEDILQAWKQLLRARNFGEVVDAQTRYAQRAYEAYMSEISKLGERYVGMTRSVPPSQSNGLLEVELAQVGIENA